MVLYLEDTGKVEQDNIGRDMRANTGEFFAKKEWEQRRRKESVASALSRTTAFKSGKRLHNVTILHSYQLE